MIKHLGPIVLVASCAFLLPACGGGGMAPPGATPDFTIGVSPGTVTATAGSTSTSTTVSVSGLNGFAGNVIVSIAGLPPGATTLPQQPFAVAASSSQALTIFVPSTTAPGNIALTITGASGLRTHSAALVLSILPAPIADFFLDATPNAVTASTGGTSGAVTVSVTGRNGFSGHVLVNLKGLPAGATTVPALPLSLAAGENRQISINVPPDAAPGSLGLTWTGESGQLVHSTILVLSVEQPRH